jgi:hypothetical protein
MEVYMPKRAINWRLCDCGKMHKIEDWRVGTCSEELCDKCLDDKHIEFIRKFPFLCPENEKHLLND